MNDWGKRLQRRRIALMGALALVTLPEIGASVVGNALYHAKHKLRTFFTPTFETPENPPNLKEDRPDKTDGGIWLGNDNEVMKLARTYADKENITIESIKVYPDEDINGTVIFNKNGHAQIKLYGIDPYRVDNNKTALHFILGHELGHEATSKSMAYLEYHAKKSIGTYSKASTLGFTLALGGAMLREAEIIEPATTAFKSTLLAIKNPDVALYEFQELSSTIIETDILGNMSYDRALSLISNAYPLLEQGIGFLQNISMAVVNNPVSQFMLGTSIFAYGAAQGVKILNSQLRKTNEYIADNFSAQLVGSDVGIQSLKELKKNDEPESTHHKQEKGFLKSAWEKVNNESMDFLYGSHPEIDNRINALERAFPVAAAGKISADTLLETNNQAPSQKKWQDAPLPSNNV